MAKRLPKAPALATAPLTEKAKKPRLKAAPLPGMEDIRIQELDGICGRISDIRERLNEARQEEGEELQQALNLMRSHRKTTWQGHGVELTRVPGQEKIRCKTSKQKASAETELGEIDPKEVPF